MRILILSIMMLFALPVEADDAQEAYKHLTVIDNFAWDGPIFLKNKKSEIQIKSIGNITKEEHLRKPNIYNKNKDILITTLYFSEGLELRYRQVEKDEQPMLVYVWVKSPKWSIESGLNVGVSEDNVLNILGNRATRNTDSIEYTGETESVTFFIKNKRVTEIHFDYYAD